MKHSEHIDLIKKAITKKGGIWADLGSGDGAFTLALRDLAGPEVVIYSVDKDEERLNIQEKNFSNQFAKSDIHFIKQDFTDNLKLPRLDGIIMANSLHYIKDKKTFLTSIQKYLKPHGQLVLVEYSIDEGNQWVPHPLSFPTFEKLGKQIGFKKIELLKKIPSSYWKEMYSANAEV